MACVKKDRERPRVRRHISMRKVFPPAADTARSPVFSGPGLQNPSCRFQIIVEQFVVAVRKANCTSYDTSIAMKCVTLNLPIRTNTISKKLSGFSRGSARSG